ncbi:ABC-F family ATP-binding cassette domain-containing protein [Oceanirhabdus seepicola]|uniref:ABC-F family ATP-binding cassette domain-containing protein n=1 Tax=Oceanirhabdus seepicola TaxID=2828781 RepID=A0A9J6NZ53_9CLOT|nr:ABC-F family ATP-binding cassette domain-containing protein [Oceanirhabdus seepicola]MCM1989571.1 ABC-F family ATP-binding cassette domain-containing protein [Oceanirhabdus seepicola]
MILQLKNVGISFDGETILSNINLKVEKKEKIGLIGVNGAGKSTILKIISGNISHEDGEVVVEKGIKVGYLKQDSGLNLENSIKEEMLEVFKDLLNVEKQLRKFEEDMAKPEIYNDPCKLEKLMMLYSKKMDYFNLHGGYEIETKINYVLNGMGFRDFPKDMEISKLSGGQKTKLALAKILLQEPDILLLDEPTNHLDFEALAWLENHIKNYKGAVLVVSHDRYFLDSLVDTIYEIERGSSKRYTGNYSKYVELKDKSEELYEKEYEEQQEKIKKLQTFIDKNIVRATSSKAAKSKRNALNRIERIDKPLKDLKRVNMKFEVNLKSHKDVLGLREATISVGSKDNRIDLIKNLNIKLTRGDKVALIGPNGIGKSTLLKTLIGDNALEKGLLNWGRNVQIGYYDQEHERLTESNTIYEEMRNEFPEIKETEVRRILGNFLFSKEDVFKKNGDLSGGEKARVALSKLMLKKANLLILDEPTNHLDLYSKEILEKALSKYDGTIIFVSHDRYFINKVANRVMLLNENGVRNFQGNYDDFLRKAI